MDIQNLSDSQKPLTILMLAYDCNPEWHSLPALVYEYYKSLSPYVSITLVTHIRNKEILSKYEPNNENIIYIDTEVVAKPLHKLAMWVKGDPNKAMTFQVASTYPSYVYFEYCVWKKFKKSLFNGEYDLVHRASPMSPTIPSFITKRSPVPFIIGPILGGLAWPKDFKDEMHREGEWMNHLRGLHRFLPYYKSTYKNASAILAGYPHTCNDIPHQYHNNLIDFPEGGITPEDYPLTQKDSTKDKLKILFVGRLVPFKQPKLLLRCFIESNKLKNHELVIVGDGPELSELKNLVDEYNLHDKVTLTGSLPINEVRELMYSSDIFAFPSIREQGGGVLTMASMASIPSVVVDYGGPSFRVPKDCGLKVALGSQEEILAGFIESLEYLIDHPEERVEMGKAARSYTEKNYSWRYKSDKTLGIYDWVLGRKKEKPHFNE